MNDIRVLSNVQVPMRDGVHLAADVYLPAGVSSAPVILSRTPYEASSDRFISLGVYFARRGYVVVEGESPEHTEERVSKARQDLVVHIQPTDDAAARP